MISRHMTLSVQCGFCLLLVVGITVTRVAAIEVDVDWSLEGGWTSGRIDLDAEIALGLASPEFEITGALSLREGGIHGLKLVGEADIEWADRALAEVHFDVVGCKAFKAQVERIPAGNGVLEAEAYAKRSAGRLRFYQLSVAGGAWSVAGWLVSFDLVLRDAYGRLRQSCESTPIAFELTSIWKASHLDEVEWTLTHTGEDWDVEEALTFDPRALGLRPTGGRLKAGRDLSDELEIDLTVDHVFFPAGLRLTKTTACLTWDCHPFELALKGTAKPNGDRLTLESISATVDWKADGLSARWKASLCPVGDRFLATLDVVELEVKATIGDLTAGVTLEVNASGIETLLLSLSV